MPGVYAGDAPLGEMMTVHLTQRELKITFFRVHALSTKTEARISDGIMRGESCL